MPKAASKPRSSRAKATRASVDNAVRGAASAFREIEDGRRFLACDVAMAALMGRREGFADACATSAIASMPKIGEWPSPASDLGRVSVRDMFAAVVLHGLLTMPPAPPIGDGFAEPPHDSGVTLSSWHDMADRVFEITDAVLAARDRSHITG